MTAEIRFPTRYLDKDIFLDINEYYGVELEMDEDLLDGFRISDFVYELEDIDDCEIENDIVRLKSYDCVDEETMCEIEDFLSRKRVPYDSIDGGERYLYSYRPEQDNRVFRLMTHMDVDGPVYSFEKLITTLDELDVLSINDPKVLKETLLRNLRRNQREGPVCLNTLATDNNFNNFRSIALLEISDLHYIV